MTLREHYAGQFAAAMVGDARTMRKVANSCANWNPFSKKKWNRNPQEFVSAVSVNLADVLLAELAKPREGAGE